MRGLKSLIGKLVDSCHFPGHLALAVWQVMVSAEPNGVTRMRGCGQRNEAVERARIAPRRMLTSAKQRGASLDEIRQLAASNPLTARITDFLLHPHFPIGIRHNAKIFREKLAVWAGRRVRE
jgi:hypothetical protein